jgi:hypothetical protein
VLKAASAAQRPPAKKIQIDQVSSDWLAEKHPIDLLKTAFSRPSR